MLEDDMRETLGDCRMLFSHTRMVLPLLMLLVAIPFIGAGQSAKEQPTKEQPTKEGLAEQVQDGPRTYDIPAELGGGAVEVFTVVGSSESKFKIGPLCQFLLADRDDNVVARVSTRPDGSKVIHLRLEMSRSGVREAVTKHLSKVLNKTVAEADIGNLPLNALRVDLFDAKLAADLRYESQPALVPDTANHLPVEVKVMQDKVESFAKAVNNGDIVFAIYYSFNNVTLDMRQHSLTAKVVAQAMTEHNLLQQGADFMSAQQFGVAGKEVVTTLVSEEIEGLGKIDPPSLTVEDLKTRFDCGDYWSLPASSLKQFDERLAERLKLSINKADFQPFRVQKRILDILNEDAMLEEKKQKYLDEYHKNRSSWDGSTGGSATFPAKVISFKAEASGSYGKQLEKVTKATDISDSDFKKLVQQYHGVEYIDEERKWRGVQIFDVQKVRQLGEARIISVRVKPTLSRSIRIAYRRPRAADAILNQGINFTYNKIPSVIPDPKEKRLVVLCGGAFTPRGVLFGAQLPNRRWEDLGPSDQGLFIAEASSGQIIRRIPTRNTAGPLVFSPDGLFAIQTAAGRGEAALHLLNLRDGTQRNVDVGNGMLGDGYRDISLSKDGRYCLLTWGHANERIIRVFDCFDWKQVHNFQYKWKHPHEALNHVIFCEPPDSVLALADMEVLKINLKTGKVSKHAGDWKQSAGSDVAIWSNEKGKAILSSGSDLFDLNRLEFLDTASMKVIGHTKTIGRHYIYSSDGTVGLGLAFDNWKPIAIETWSGRVLAEGGPLRRSEDVSYALAPNGKKALIVYRLKDEEPLRSRIITIPSPQIVGPPTGER